MISEPSEGAGPGGTRAGLTMTLLEIARELQAMAQTGLHFTLDPYDRDRYQRLRELSAILLAERSDIDAEEILEWNRSEFGYATPKVDVRAFVLKEQKVLLIREEADGGRWTLPGGWADVNETPSESVVREVREECGYEVQPLRLLAVLDREKQGHTPPFPYHVYKLFFHCELIGGQATSSSESSASNFFRADQLPELSLSRVLPDQIARFFQAVQTQALQSEFD